jgi:hypothetical protein
VDVDVIGDLQLNVGFELLWSLVFFMFSSSFFGRDKGFRAKKSMQKSDGTKPRTL